VQEELRQTKVQLRRLEEEQSRAKVEELRASIKETAEKTEEVGKSHQALWQRYKELSNPKNKDAEDRAFDEAKRQKREQTLLTEIKMLEHENASLHRDKERLAEEINTFSGQVIRAEEEAEAEKPQGRAGRRATTLH
jgi:hypothetical protein